MLHKLLQFATYFQDSEGFTGHVEQGGPAAPDLVEQLSAAFAALGHAIPASLAQFYRAHDGLTVRWVEKQPTHPDFLTSGDLSVPPIDTMIQALRYAPEDFALFDYLSELQQVGLRVAAEGVGLWLVGEDLDNAVRLPLSVDNYFRLADECRGLQPWQEVIISGRALDPELREKFFRDLHRLFPDADQSRFSSSATDS